MKYLDITKDLVVHSRAKKIPHCTDLQLHSISKNPPIADLEVHRLITFRQDRIRYHSVSRPRHTAQYQLVRCACVAFSRSQMTNLQLAFIGRIHDEQRKPNISVVNSELQRLTEEMTAQKAAHRPRTE